MVDLTLFSAPQYPSIAHDAEDPRLSNLIHPASASAIAEADVVLFGVPTDEGIRRNGGRIGASKAPAAIREWLGKLTPYAGPQFKGQITDIRIADLGDIQGSDLEETHELATLVAEDIIAQGKIAVALGGGHDVTYPLAKGFHRGGKGKRFGLINIDAHLDVRPRKNGQHHSGSSFRLLLDEGIVTGSQFCEIGIQSFAASQFHFDWLIQQGARILTFEDATTAHLPHAYEECEFVITLGDPDVPVYLSFDMDAVRAADAPGVSAPSPIGFLAEEAYELAAAAGLSRHVQMLDLVELNPEFDFDGRTARLAARMIAMFLAGVANREYR